jgi:hypothetical protein
VTRQKWGWDCFRHYEILGNGAVPYFLDLESSPEQTMALLPKGLLLKARQMAGVPQFDFSQLMGQDHPGDPGYTRAALNIKTLLTLDRAKFDEAEYFELASQLLEYTQRRLTTHEVAKYVLAVTKNANARSVLFINDGKPDYQKDLLLHGLRSVLGSGVVEWPKVGGSTIPSPAYFTPTAAPLQAEHMYDFDPFVEFDEEADVQKLKDARVDGGRGGGASMGFTFRLNDDPAIDRTHIETRVKSHEFDLVVYGGIHRAWNLLDEVTAAYSSQHVIFVDGEDIPLDSATEKLRYMEDAGEPTAYTKLAKLGHLFIREMKDGCPEDEGAWVHTQEGHWKEMLYNLPATHWPEDWLPGLEE